MAYKNDPFIKKAYDDERLFVLMARDPAAPKCILHWIAKSIDSQPAEKIREALDCALEMKARGQEFRDQRDEEAKRKEYETKEHELMKGDAKKWRDLVAQSKTPVGNYEGALKQARDAFSRVKVNGSSARSLTTS